MSHYVINDNVLTTYYPVETWHSGSHILNLYYPLNGLEANAYNTFRVWVKMADGSATVGRGQAICTISGQGLSSNNTWDGRLEFEDQMDVVRIGGALEVVAMATTVSVHMEIPDSIGVTEGFKLISFGGISIVGISDEVQVNPVIVTETIEVADRDEMEYNDYFVKTESVFEFETAYEFTSQEYPIDRGRMTKLVTDTEQFARIDNLEVE